MRQDDQWKHQAKLTHPSPQFNDRFGYAVAVFDDIAIVGADLDDHSGWTNAGSASVFHRIGDTWSQQAMLTASDATDVALFGVSVALSEHQAIVGAQYHDQSDLTNNGAAYVYARSGDTWIEQAKFIASDTAIGDAFGRSVALHGNLAIVGAWGDDHPGASDAGSAYIFNLPAAMGDVTHDGTVDVEDLLAVIDAWGPCPAPPSQCSSDLDCNGDTDVDDLLTVINTWG